MKTLLVISRAHGETAFKLAEELYKDGDEIVVLFTGRGTFHVSDPGTVSQLGFAKLISIDEEFNSPISEVNAVSYEDFIKILEKCERTFTWI